MFTPIFNKLSSEELKNWNLSKKIKLLLMLKLVYSSDSFDMNFILKSNLPSFAIKKCEFFRLWNKTGIL